MEKVNINGKNIELTDEQYEEIKEVLKKEWCIDYLTGCNYLVPVSKTKELAEKAIRMKEAWLLNNYKAD